MHFAIQNITNTTTLTTLIIPIVLGIILIIVLIWIMRIEKRINRLFIGKDSMNIEDSVYHITQDIKTLQKFTDDMEGYLTSVETRLKKSVQSVETVRFNPFKGTGS